MERREFLKLTPAIPAAGSAVALVATLPDGSSIETDVSVLRLQPGDIVCVRTPKRLSSVDGQHVVDCLHKAFPVGQKVIVLTDEMEIGVIRPVNGS